MKTIKQLVAEYVAQAQLEIKEHEAIYQLLLEVNDKPIDGRTFNKKRLGDFKLERDYNMFHIIGKHGRHLIGYNSNPFVDAEKFKEFDACYGMANSKRIEQLQTMDIERLQDIQNNIANSFNNIIDQFRNMEKEHFDSYHNPIYYQMLQEIHNDEKDKTHSKIVLSDFYYLMKNQGKQ